MSINLQNKKITKQVRVSEHIHQKIKFEATRRRGTMSRLVDEIIEEYFAHKDISKNIAQIKQRSN